LFFQKKRKEKKRALNPRQNIYEKAHGDVFSVHSVSNLQKWV
jgi:hypothetical protein